MGVSVTDVGHRVPGRFGTSDPSDRRFAMRYTNRVALAVAGALVTWALGAGTASGAYSEVRGVGQPARPEHAARGEHDFARAERRPERRRLLQDQLGRRDQRVRRYRRSDLRAVPVRLCREVHAGPGVDPDVEDDRVDNGQAGAVITHITGPMSSWCARSTAARPPASSRRHRSSHSRLRRSAADKASAAERPAAGTTPTRLNGLIAGRSQANRCARRAAGRRAPVGRLDESREQPHARGPRVDRGSRGVTRTAPVAREERDAPPGSWPRRGSRPCRASRRA